MHWTHLNYLPLTTPFFLLLAGLFVLLFLLIAVRALRYAYQRMGLSLPAVLILLLSVLLGSYINIPVAQLPDEQVLVGQEVSYFGMVYVVPAVVEWPGTIIAVNLGGAVIPTVFSLYLLIKNRLWISGLVAVLVMTFLIHQLARPVRGVGIAVPEFAPPIAAAAVAWLLSRRYAAPLAFIGGTLGTLIGADLLNLGAIAGLGAPIASIGGAGTVDGIFLAGLLAVVFASIPGRRENSNAEGSGTAG
jgi:uncharacterized membrane protein